MKNEKKTAKPDARANLITLRRTFILMALFGVLAFIPLFGRLYELQIRQHDELEAKALNQQTRDSAVAASRGTIYDSKGTTLAMSGTVYNVQLSPRDIVETQQAYAKKVETALAKDTQKAREAEMPDYPEPTNAYIAENLARILDLEEGDILKRLAKTNSQYEIIKQRIEGDEVEELNAFIVKNHLSHGISLPPTTKRYYPSGSLAATVLGWVNYNVENKGAYGLEALYEDELAGQTGRVVTAKNGKGTEMLYQFEDYYDAVNGNDLTLTLDSTIQYFCERILEKGIDTFEVRNGGFAIAMDPNTGAILAWADSPTYDPNNPREILDPTLQAKVQAGTPLVDVQYEQWKSKSIADTYEPGSTFKSVVLASALEEGVIDESSSFTCSGVVTVADRQIHCSNRTGHGTQNLALAVANSCNPAFISIGQRLGASKFYDYLEDFGFLEKTGIDIQGEQDRSNLIWSRDDFTGPYGVTSLATASFGQRFSVTPIQMITAASAVVNGGRLMQPHILQSITDPEGNVVKHVEPTEVRQVVSQETSQRCRTILESVVDGGTGKQAYRAGYRIGGKTGSSETLEKDHTIVSFLGFAPADDPKVVILLAYDNPKPAFAGAKSTSRDWYISGGNMAAPMAGELLENILNYMGVQKVYADKDLAQMDVSVPNVVGMNKADATAKLESAQFKIRTVGDGEAVTGQVPTPGAAIPGGSTIILYMGVEQPTELVEVPDLQGKSQQAATDALSQLGLYLKATGTTGVNSKALSQSIEPGTKVAPGTVIPVRFMTNLSSGAGAGL